jgi:DNA mismatch repair protein MutS2
LADRVQHGRVLDPSDLLQVRFTLQGARQARRRLTRLNAQLPGLADIAGRIVELGEVREAIGSVLTDRGEIRDDASPELVRIRRELRTTQDRIQDKLQRMIGSSNISRYLQEAIITRREGRYVIPVQAVHKSKVEGIVHDRSSSGVTYFMEPVGVVDLNNRLRELTLAEEEEIQRLLVELTWRVGEVADEIRATVAALAELDLTFAKARYAEELFAAEPTLHSVPRASDLPAPAGDNLRPGTVLHFKAARHPLLDPDEVVPVDVFLDDDVHILVITGPNTGGKTVTLKTVGLLTLMAQAGMHIPVDEGSALTCFEAVYADIGDEQSIEQNLSTFSSHLANILSFFEDADHRTLVLLDELGAGTDPAEGSALARALLDALRRQRCTALVATHYPELKLYAHNTPGVTNASMEFDSETLAPTYRLTIGLPGRSNAFAIAQRLGLPESIVENAEGMISGESLRADEMLDDLHQLRVETAEARDSHRRALQKTESQAQVLRKRLSNIETERQKILHEARETARDEVEALQKEVRDLRRRLRLGVPTRSPETSLEEAEAAVNELAARVSASETKSQSLVEDVAPPDEPLEGEPQVGDRVQITSLGMEGTVMDREGQEVEVQAGAMRTRVSLDAVQLITRAANVESPAEDKKTPTAAPKAASPGVEVDLRGMTVHEARERLDRYLDDAALAQLPWVRIIHGKGTGTLRRAMRTFLQQHPLVSSYESAPPREGGDGVTVAQMVGV